MPYSERYKRMLNRMGYYNYQHGLIYRHLNQDGGWDSHLDNCRRFILKAIGYYKPGKVTILGSGWLLDLPLAELSELVSEVVLVDIVHPPEVRTQVDKFHNIRIIEADITGGLIEKVWNLGRKKFPWRKTRVKLDSVHIPVYIPENDPGLIISLNILSQLDVLITDFLKEKTLTEREEILKFTEEIQKKHIDFLREHKSVLISDTVEIFNENSGDKTLNRTVIAELPEGKFREDWLWNFDLKGSDYYNKNSYFEVVAIMI